MTDPVTPAKNLLLPTIGGDDNLWGAFLNNNFTLVDQAIGGTLAISIVGNLTLTSIQAQNTGYTFTGSLSVQTTITFPSYYGFIVISNQTTGGQTLLVGYASGVKSTIASGETTVLWADGANVRRLSQAIINFPLAVGLGGTGADLSATGGAHQVLKQSTIGGPISIGQLTSSDISGLVSSATIDTTNAANITSGTLSNSRLVSVPNTALQNSTFVISGHTVSLGGSLSLVSGDVSGLATSATTDTTNASNISSGVLPTGRLSGAYAGVSGLGTVTSGVWQGNAVDVAHGGTGATSVGGAFSNLVVAAASLPNNDNAPGYVQFQNGFIIQWGIQMITTNALITYPIPFPNHVGSVTATVASGFPATVTCAVAVTTANNFVVNLSGAFTVNVLWMAFGA